jgi:S1-C subfamily serine protease
VFRWSVILLAPVASSALLGAPLADRFGAGVAERLSNVARLLPRAPAAADEPELTAERPPAPAPDLAFEAKVSAPAKRGARAKGAKPKGPLPGVRVSKAVVLSLAERRVRPSGKPVAAQGNRPAGIALFGVGALGLGVLDGDVLTEVEGQPARAPGQVIEAIVRARGRRAGTISGVLYRGQERFVLVVEQPY